MYQSCALAQSGPPIEKMELTLRNGDVLEMRALDRSDLEMLGKFVAALSEETIHYRFLTSGISKEAMLMELSPAAGCFSLVGVRGRQILGLASYCRTGRGSAEIGLIVADDYQGQGLGTALTEQIARFANAEGISVFEAVIDWNNVRMIKLVRTLGFPTSERVEPDIIRIRFPTSMDPVSISEFQERWVFRAP